MNIPYMEYLRHMNYEFYDNISAIPSHLKRPTEQNGKRRSCKIDISYGLVHPLLHEHWLTCATNCCTP